MQRDDVGVVDDLQHPPLALGVFDLVVLPHKALLQHLFYCSNFTSPENSTLSRSPGNHLSTPSFHFQISPHLTSPGNSMVFRSPGNSIISLHLEQSFSAATVSRDNLSASHFTRESLGLMTQSFQRACFHRRLLAYSVIYYSGKVPREHLLLPWFPSLSLSACFSVCTYQLHHVSSEPFLFSSQQKLRGFCVHCKCRWFQVHGKVAWDSLHRNTPGFSHRIRKLPDSSKKYIEDGKCYG